MNNSAPHHAANRTVPLFFMVYPFRLACIFPPNMPGREGFLSLEHHFVL